MVKRWKVKNIFLFETHAISFAMINTNLIPLLLHIFPHELQPNYIIINVPQQWRNIII